MGGNKKEIRHMKRIISRIFFCAAVLAGAAACEEAGNVETEKPAPRLISIVPGTGYVGCTAIISGEYFSEVPEENVVTVDGVTVPVTAATRNRLTLTMPEHELGDVLVGLTVNGKEASTTLKFTYAELPELVMTVSGINPEKGYAGDEVVISGENFSLKSSDNKVTFDGVVAQIVKVTQNTIKVIAPEHARGKVEVKVEVDGKKYTVVTNYSKCFTGQDLCNWKFDIKHGHSLMVYRTDHEDSRKSWHDNNLSQINKCGSCAHLGFKDGGLGYCEKS